MVAEHRRIGNRASDHLIDTLAIRVHPVAPNRGAKGLNPSYLLDIPGRATTGLPARRRQRPQCHGT
jgi:hypothetical protein